MNTVTAFIQQWHRETCMALLAAFGLACGFLASALLETRWQPDLQPRPPRAVSDRTTPALQTRDDLELIIRRNIFDPADRGRTSFQPPAEADGATRQASLRQDLKLLGTMVAGSASTAVIRVGSETTVFLLGEEIPGGGKLEEVNRHQVALRLGDRTLAHLVIDGEALRGRADQPGVGDDDVRAVGERQWKISRSLAESVRENIGEQMRLARLEPRLVNGQTAGFLIRHVDPRSLLSKMGLKRGDIVQRVNGMQLDSPEQALQILQQLREARRLSVDIERNRQPLTLAYELE